MIRYIDAAFAARGSDLYVYSTDYRMFIYYSCIYFFVCVSLGCHSE